MRSFNLNIAGYKIRFESAERGPEMFPSERFHSFIVSEANQDILIRVHSGKFNMPLDAKMIFDAPYVEETNGIRLKKNDEFWSILKHGDHLFIKTIFPHTGHEKQAVLRFSFTGREWDLWINGKGMKTNPMEYPLDGLILYYLSVVFGDIMIHASGVNHAGRGYLFSGVSGKGKTTMAKLWDKHGARIIHDDRLILRKKNKGYFMFNTPVYSNENPSESRIDKIFIIEHGRENKIVPVNGAECVSLIMANCIQHNWDHAMISGLLNSVSQMSESIPVAKLFFRSDKSIIDFILENERR